MTNGQHAALTYRAVLCTTASCFSQPAIPIYMQCFIVSLMPTQRMSTNIRESGLILTYTFSPQELVYHKVGVPNRLFVSVQHKGG